MEQPSRQLVQHRFPLQSRDGLSDSPSGMSTFVNILEAAPPATNNYQLVQQLLRIRAAPWSTLPSAALLPIASLLLPADLSPAAGPEPASALAAPAPHSTPTHNGA